MTERPPAPDLTSDLDYWQVTLTSGQIISVRAHAYGREDDDYVFVALMRGTPNYEYELLRLPASAVADVEGGWPAQRESSTGED